MVRFCSAVSPGPVSLIAGVCGGPEILWVWMLHRCSVWSKLLRNTTHLIVIKIIIIKKETKIVFLVFRTMIYIVQDFRNGRQTNKRKEGIKIKLTK